MCPNSSFLLRSWVAVLSFFFCFNWELPQLLRRFTPWQVWDASGFSHLRTRGNSATSTGPEKDHKVAASSWCSGSLFLLSRPEKGVTVTPFWGTGLQGLPNTRFPPAWMHCKQRSHSHSCHTRWWTRPCRAWSPSPVVHRSVGRTQKSVGSFYSHAGSCAAFTLLRLPTGCLQTHHSPPLHPPQPHLLLWQWACGGGLPWCLPITQQKLLPKSSSNQARELWIKLQKTLITFIPESTLLGIYLFFLNPHQSICSTNFGKWGREREWARERERGRNIDRLSPIHVPSSEWTRNLGMCPDSTTFWCVGQCSNPPSHLARAGIYSQ